MFLKKFKPTTNGVRHKISLSSYFLNFKKFIKFKSGFKKNSGRNITGSITVRHKQNYTSNSYIFVDFKRNYTKLGVSINVSKDSNRNCLISLIRFSTGAFSYIIAPHGCMNGMLYSSTTQQELFVSGYKIGFNTFLKNLPIRSIFFNSEIVPGFGGKYARSAGTYCTLISFDFERGVVKIKLPSEKILYLSPYCFVSLGRSSNIFSKNLVSGNAGFNVRKGSRPTVRGVAMNPVDHPHGGRTKTNSPEVTP